jgi:hypothetical protein
VPRFRDEARMSRMPSPRVPHALACLLASAVSVAAVGCSTSGSAMSQPASVVTPTVTPVGSASPAASDDVVRIPLSGAAPDAIVLDGGRAWVLAGEGGSLIEVDLAGGREVRAIDVGFGPTHLVLPDPRTAAIARFDNSGNGFYLVLVDLETGAVDGVPTNELGGLALGEDGVVWALEKADRLLKIDMRTAEVRDAVVEVGENVHMEVQWGVGSAWVGSDGTPTLRVAGSELTLEDSIDVPTGLPFLFTGGLVWGAGPSELWAIDPTTNAVTRQVPLEDVIEILALDIQGDEGWVAVRRTGQIGRVLRLDLATGQLVAELPVSLPAAVRIGADRAWVASYLTNELLGFAR